MWEPEDKNSTVVIDYDGYAKELQCNNTVKDRVRQIGNLYGSEKEAREAEKFHRDNRLIRKFIEYYDPKWLHNPHIISEDRYFVFYDRDHKQWSYNLKDSKDLLGVLYMPQHVAEKLCYDLNNQNLILD